ncbi:hypothetical protein VOLCADRAFT_68314 [Volvox carteri f. nagariensis]|uniref:Uncharacterized protein n=1 Tax=Volvox carteri f. nagariensis TaxID=3068 RepID=D8UFW4_VOLCA|nr:uncharacterized protein VOLCADRAFT_68314 [Volvox carteri f. nagariensis]EFJ41407.1 hypothetical protein VOLCADRAFT_68314 [Volvox carteri f. nagariensis]|eukprot:XP_002957513.1 hypothetical protein VOLCADRAFT_68314 [Volvox carteri f. nagariensis]
MIHNHVALPTLPSHSLPFLSCVFPPAPPPPPPPLPPPPHQENNCPPEVLRCNMDSLNSMARGGGGGWGGKEVRGPRGLEGR